MTKNYYLLFLFILGNLLGFSQSPVVKFSSNEGASFSNRSPSNILSTSTTKKRRILNTKAFGDTLYTQNFSNGLPSNYTISNLGQSIAVWRWDTSYVNLRGMYSQSTPSINSSTATDGFMVLPSDFYNTPMGLAIIMDTWFTSAKITIPSTPGVFIKYEQFLRFCCRVTNELVLEISTDSTNWDTYDASRGLIVNELNAPLTNPVEEVIFDVSTSLANQTQFWYRFRSTGNSHYFWMIDDVLFFEGPKQDIMLTEEALNFNVDNYTIHPFYKQIPLEVFPTLSFSGKMTNRGWVANTNVTFNAEVSLSGSGIVYSSSFNAGTLTQGQDTFVTTGMPRFASQSLGDFQVNLLAAGDSIDQFPGNETWNFDFSVTDSVYARDDNQFDNGIGPASYGNLTNTSAGGTTVGDRFGSLYIIEPRNSSIILPKSVTYRVSGNPSNIGVEIVPKIWLFNEDSASLTSAFVAEVASSNSPYTVTASDTNTFITLQLNTGSAATAGLDSGQYVVGWEVTTLPTGTSFEVLNDRSTALLQPSVSNFFWLGQEQVWRWSADNPGIRLNISSIPVGIEDHVLTENNFEFKIYPNPSNGQFRLEMKSPQEKGFTLTIRNILGQKNYNEIIQVNGSSIKDIDITTFDKGVYFLSLENESERFVKKIVLN